MASTQNNTSCTVTVTVADPVVSPQQDKLSTPILDVLINPDSRLYTTSEQSQLKQIKHTKQIKGSKASKSSDPSMISLVHVQTFYRKNDVPGDSTDGTLFAVDYIKPNGKKSSQFFRMDYIQFYHRLLLTDLANRIYYECLEHDNRKPYADIEYEFLPKDKNSAIRDFFTVFNCVLLGIDSEMKSKGVSYVQDRDTIILSAHGYDKLSIHIIINNWYFNSLDSQTCFWKTIRSKYVPKHLWHFVRPEKTPTIIDAPKEIPKDVPLIFDNSLPKKHRDPETLDMAVYSVFRQFRLIWNTKIDKNRFFNLDHHTGIQARFPKAPDDPINMPLDLQAARLFEACLISMTSNCTPLPFWVDTSDKSKSKFKPVNSLTEQETIDLADAFNATEYGKLYEIKYHQSTSANSLYLVPHTRPCKCPCGREHDNNNARIATSGAGNKYFFCFATRTFIFFNKLGVFDKPRKANASDDIIEVDPSTMTFLGLPNSSFDHSLSYHENVANHLASEINTINETNELKVDSSPNKRIPAIPIVGGVLPTQMLNTLTVPNSNEKSHYGPPCQSLMSIENLKTTMVDRSDFQSNNEGQLLLPNNDTTIETFLHMNTKYLCWNKYNIQELFDSYEKYRGDYGIKYFIKGGKTKNFGSALMLLGHCIERKSIGGRKGQKIKVVTLKRDPSISPNDPIEEFKMLFPDKSVSKLVRSPEETYRLLKENATKATNIATNSTDNTTENPKDPDDLTGYRAMNKHVDIRNFCDIYMKHDPDSEIDIENLFKCFVGYCIEKSIFLERFGQTSLKNYIVQWKGLTMEGRMIKGYRCEVDKEAINNAAKEKNLRKIWKYNNRIYQIGWRNGKGNEIHSKLESRPWRNVDVNYSNDIRCKPISELIQMTKEYEDNLPQQVKDIQYRQSMLCLAGLGPYYPEDINTHKMRLTNALISGEIIENSDEHINMKNRIDQLQEEALRAFQVDFDALEASIREDKERIRREVSWCCAVRSTFGTGKTFNLKPYIEAFPDMSVLIVLPRISLAQDYIREYQEMGFVVCNEDTKGKIDANRIITCLPSLNKVTKEKFDLVILDEYKAIMDLQHTLVKKNKKRNKTSGRYQTQEMKCYYNLCHFVANSQRVYVADALLSNAHVLEISRMRQQSQEYSGRVTVYQNMYQKHDDCVVYTVNNRDLLVNKILKFLRKGKRVAVPTNCKEFADFLYRVIMDSDMNISISLSTSDNKSNLTITERFQNVNCIIYTPTVLAGNSYEEPVDVVCGYFTTASCDYADSLQMLMRCRNIVSKKYFVCVTPGPRRSPIPSVVNPSTTEVTDYLANVDEINMTGWPEEFIIPMDMIASAPCLKGIRKDDMYFMSYCNYMKQVHVASHMSDKGCEFLFRMLLAMRDAGFKYGGNKYVKTAEKDNVDKIRIEKKLFALERRTTDLDEKYNCDKINTEKFLELTNKNNHSKDENRQILKYQIRQKYQVEDVPKWLFETDRKHSVAYTRITRYQGLNGVSDKATRTQLQVNIRKSLMEEIHPNQIRNVTTPTITSAPSIASESTSITSDTIFSEDTYNLPSDMIRLRPELSNITNEIILSEEAYNPVRDITKIWTDKDIKLCENALKILELMGVYEFIRQVPRFIVPYNGNNDFSIVLEYVKCRETELRLYLNDSTRKPSKIDNIASKITTKAFGIKFKAEISGYNINNKWIKNGNLIWPFNYEIMDLEELKIIVPEPTKVTTWINDKIRNLGLANNNVVSVSNVNNPIVHQPRNTVIDIPNEKLSILACMNNMVLNSLANDNVAPAIPKITMSNDVTPKLIMNNNVVPIMNNNVVPVIPKPIMNNNVVPVIPKPIMNNNVAPAIPKITMSNDVVSKSIINNNVVPKPIMNNNVVHVIPKITMSGDVVSKPIINNNIISKPIINNNVIPKPIINNNVAPAIPKITMSNDLVPKPLINNKISVPRTSVNNNVITKIRMNNNVLHAPPIGAYVDNKVLSSAVTVPTVTQTIAHKRVPVMPIVDPKLTLANLRLINQQRSNDKSNLL